MRKKIAVFALLLVFITGMAFAEASSGNKEIEVAYRDISVLVDGSQISPDAEPFIYEGRTFVPIRFVAEALRENVTWDQEKYQVRIAQPLILDETFNGKTIYISKDFQLFTIALAGNPTTGYSWQVKDFDHAFLKAVGEPLYQSETSTVPLVGQGGTFFFSFLTQGKEGEVKLEFAYSRPWESVPPEKEFSITVKIGVPGVPISLKEEDSGSAVCLSLDKDTLNIVLPGNPSTGYSWEIVSCDGSILSMTSEDPFFEAESEALGAPGTYTFKFAPISLGKTDLRLIYVKTGESGPPEKDFSLKVGVF